MKQNRTIWFVFGAVLVLLLAGGFAATSLKKDSKQAKPPGFLSSGSFRAVLVPTDDGERTVVVTPCNAPPPSSTRSAGEHLSTPGVTKIQLQQGSGLRTVLVPRCVAEQGTMTNGAANLPSAAFVLKEGERPPAVQADVKAAVGVQSHLTLPERSTAGTIVVPPCVAGKGPTADATRQIVLNPRAAAAGTAVAPSC